MIDAIPTERRATVRRAAAARAWRLAMRTLAFAWATLLCAGLAFAQDLPPVPALTGRVIDHTGALDAGQKSSLEAKLAAFEAKQGTQIAILIVPSTGQEDIAAFAFRVADEWKIGRRSIGDGILLVVAKDDRRIRIEVARALEGAVPDLAAFQIINRLMAPAFREGDYAAGLHAGVDALMARIRGEALPLPDEDAPPAEGTAAPAGLGLVLFMAVPLVGGVLAALLGRKLGALATSGGAAALALFLTGSVLLAVLAAVLAFIFVLAMGIGGGGGRGGGPHIGGGPVIWGGGHGGRSGRGFGSGGGFRSGGGGSFGGGGASGGW